MNKEDRISLRIAAEEENAEYITIRQFLRKKGNFRVHSIGDKGWTITISCPVVLSGFGVLRFMDYLDKPLLVKGNDFYLVKLSDDENMMISKLFNIASGNGNKYTVNKYIEENK